MLNVIKRIVLLLPIQNQF